MNKNDPSMIVYNHTAFAVGAGLIPIPLVDFAAVTAIQIDMLNELAEHYGVGFTRDVGKRFIAALVGGGIARVGASAIKSIPGVGTVVGIGSMAVLSGASTYAVGMMAKEYFSQGRSIDPEKIDVSGLKERFTAVLEEGKAVAAGLAAKVSTPDAATHGTTPAAPSVSPDMPLHVGPNGGGIRQIGEYHQLHTAGVLSAEEFAAKKASVLKLVVPTMNQAQNVSTLKAAHDLLKAGALTEEEFTILKTQFLLAI